MPAARSTTARSPVSSAAVTSSRLCVPASSRAAIAAKASSICRPAGRGSGNACSPASSAVVSTDGSSSSAMGFPPVRAISCFITAVGSAGVRLVSRATALFSDRPRTWHSGRPLELKRWASPSLAANSRTIPSACRRRAMKSSASADGSSNQCALSTRQTSPVSAAKSDIRVRAATATRNRSGTGADAKPNALLNATPCSAGKSSTRSRAGYSNWWRAAYGSCTSDSTPSPRNRWQDALFSAA